SLLDLLSLLSLLDLLDLLDLLCLFPLFPLLPFSPFARLSRSLSHAIKLSAPIKIFPSAQSALFYHLHPKPFAPRTLLWSIIPSAQKYFHLAAKRLPINNLSHE
ncbi:hypothetical protein, partial [Paenibacillus koleovorans]|uniref:hypothetical protein n=1 Tax=Paenibacillus koleovorans TaxID=121608 RepID=UPI001C3F919B